MSPRAHSDPATTRSTSQPYARRPSGQPKSSRQQFSACGACRMRRVRCDLKDISIPVTGPHPACSNCKERGLKCVDEFADVKAVKLLRRGRRLQQVEAIYGKEANQNSSSSSYLGLPTRIPSTIPTLHSDFFDSAFWQWFSLQRPILDGAEFSARFCAHAKGADSLGYEGSLLAMVLVVWAASFGLDERGIPSDESSGQCDSDSLRSNNRKGGMDMVPTVRSKTNERDPSAVDEISVRRGRKERSEAMLREVLELADIHGIMRRPTWDGVKVLLLILPLLEDEHPLDRLTMHEASLSQAHSLCTLLSGPPSSMPSISSGSSESPDEALMRARIFWYAHMQEGITTGMRGGRLLLSEDDLDVFQRTLPPFRTNSPRGLNVVYTSGVGLPSPNSPTFPSGMSSDSLRDGSPHSGAHSYLSVTHLFSIPLHLSSVCRKIHAVLTGAKASRTAELGGGVDAEGMREVWEGLDTCWDEFEAIRRGISTSAGGSMLGDVDVWTERFVSCWQIFIFECHNVIRESLKQYGSSPNTPANRSPARSPSPFASPRQLHDVASRKCFRLLPCVLSIIKHHLTLTYESADPTGLFKWDTGLVRDGCFFAAFLSASVDSEQLIDYATYEPPVRQFRRFKQEPSERSSNSFGSGGGVDIVRPGLLPILDADEGTRICLAAIAEMQWAFSKSEEREEAIRIIWEDNKLKKQRQDQQHFNAVVGQHNIPSLPELETRYQPHHQQISSSYMIHGQQNGLSPLSLTSPTHSAPNSAPVTACTTDGSGANGWPSYTPPGTSSSSNGTSLSAQGSPVFTTNITTIPNSYKNDDNFYHVVGVSDMDHFSFNAPATPVDPTSMMTAYQRNTTHVSSNNGVVHNGSGYLEYAAGGTSATPVLGHTESDGCPPHFVEDVHGFYH
ncbi:hypothetical protein C8R41DRAFT_843688 [Lentinula lateritia]|uniref:Zn(2)-C6 fungal-type domain-containing protein n=1 Tax=Lentinula lateritia TaxID=40482 RepID=A0ABQ8V873_9AGAR|nr:hypothetical protein C8R41DRAFT_843688 [Lentinula lateritia]